MSEKRSTSLPARGTPFIQRYGTIPCNDASRDHETFDDPLPDAVALNSDGLTIRGATRLTEVRQETTDDR